MPDGQLRAERDANAVLVEQSEIAARNQEHRAAHPERRQRSPPGVAVHRLLARGDAGDAADHAEARRGLRRDGLVGEREFQLANLPASELLHRLRAFVPSSVSEHPRVHRIQHLQQQAVVPEGPAGEKVVRREEERHDLADLSESDVELAGLQHFGASRRSDFHLGADRAGEKIFHRIVELRAILVVLGGDVFYPQLVQLRHQLAADFVARLGVVPDAVYSCVR